MTPNTPTATDQPTNPVEAVRHLSPYPYYEALAGRPPWFDEGLGMWIVADAHDVVALLNCEAAKVRPVGEPCPGHLNATAAGETIQRIVRMNDGPEHQRIRDTVDAWFASLTPARVEEACEKARDSVRSQNSDLRLMDQWMRTYPCAVMVLLMGINADATASLTAAAQALADAFGPGAGADTTNAANEAVTTIVDALDEPRKVMANVAAGLVFQTFDATAALIGNTIAHLARHSSGARDERHVAVTIDHVLRFDPAVHNTRRFLDADITIGNLTITAGSTVLLVLAAANIDSARPHQLDTVAFGAGPHKCPADKLAVSIARHGVTAIIDAYGEEPLPVPASYSPRQNSRIPVFTTDRTDP